MNRPLLGMCCALVAAYGCQQVAGLDDFQSAQRVGSGGQGGSGSGGVDGNAGQGGTADGGNASSTGGKSSGGSANTGGKGGTDTGGASSGGSGSGGENTGGSNTGGSGTGGGASACATNNGGCDEHADCADNGSGAVCTCQPAYLGSGETCVLRTVRVGLAAYDPPPSVFTGSPVISRDGRFVAFSSTDETLVSGDSNGKSDIFVRNLVTGVIELVSVGNNEAQSNGMSRYPAISGDGRYVVFSSIATNLIPVADTNGYEDVFIRDRTEGTTQRVSVASNGTQGNAAALMADVSDNGRYVAFASYAANLVTDDTNGAIDIFLRDLTTNTTTRESIRSDESQDNDSATRPAISADGSRIAFESMGSMGLSDAGGFSDIFVRDRTAGTTTRVSKSTGGAQSDGASAAAAISGDGRYVAFHSTGTNLVSGDLDDNTEVFLHDLSNGQTTRVALSSTGAVGNSNSSAPALSYDGRYVAFGSQSDNLVTGDTNALRDVFVFDRQAATTVRVSVSALGAQSDGASRYPSISGDGSAIAFDSAATNLVPDDTNELIDLFVRRR